LAGGWSSIDSLEGSELREQALALRCLLAVNEAILQGGEIQELAEKAIAALLEFAHYPCVAFFLRSEDQRELELVASRGFDQKIEQAAYRLPTAGSFSGLVLQSGSILHCSDLRHDERLEPRVRELLRANGFVQVVGVPMGNHREVYGVINLIYRAPTFFSATESRLLRAIGTSLATTLAQREEHRRCLALESKVHQSERLASFGVLAGGIAHDFNNVLQVLFASLGVLRQGLADQRDPHALVDEHISESSRAILHARDLISQLLTFSRGGAPLKRPNGGVAALIRDAAEFCVHGSSVELEFDLSPALPSADLANALLAQVVQNMILCAVELAGPRSKICVRTPMVQEAPARSGSRSTENELVIEISVAHARSEAMLANAESREQQDDGLASARSIMAQHGGSLEAERQEASTRLIARIPATPTSGKAVEVGVAPGTERPPRLLVLEDEPAIMRLLTRTLQSLGYAFDVVVDGESAVSYARQSMAEQRPYDLLLFDLTIRGGLGGREALQAIRVFQRKIRAIATTGYSLHSPEELSHEGFAAVLPKPYTIDQLAQVIQRSLRQSLN
jgi:CheY-like chemotaxis protein/signal transduction histidine kinase